MGRRPRSAPLEPATKSVSVRVAIATAARAEALAAAVPQLTSLNRILARAVELGLEGVERELAGAVQTGKPTKPKNGDGRADVRTEAA